jgi:hypothetical protein
MRNESILENLQTLSRMGKEIIIRMVVTLLTIPWCHLWLYYCCFIFLILSLKNAPTLSSLNNVNPKIINPPSI